MKTKVKKILKAWRIALENQCDVLSDEIISQSAEVLADYMKEKEDTKAIRKMVREVRDDILVFNGQDHAPLLRKIQRIFVLLNKVRQSKSTITAQPSKKNHRKGKRPVLEGQEVRYKSETQKIFGEKLRFKDGMPLRSFDVDVESACDSRKVRRIIEKRMCQAYHKMRKSSKKTESSNRDRYWMRRATSFQLYNIGQIEDTDNFSRGLSTHWKKIYDRQAGKWVFKKKMAYSSYEEACAAIEKWKIDHPRDHEEMLAYQCSVCHKWHIGHKSPLAEVTEVYNVDYRIDNVLEIAS